MTAFLAEVGTKLADRWAAALVAPGLLLVAAIAVAAHLGQAQALDIGLARGWINAVAASPGSHSPGALLVAAGGVLAAASAAGLAAAMLGQGVELIWSFSGANQLTDWRRRRWDKAKIAASESNKAAFRRALDPHHAQAVGGASHADAPGHPPVLDPGVAIVRQHAISLVEPCCPTWIGDRLRAADVRVHLVYGLDLGAAWPRLWTLSSTELRADLGAAQDAYSGAARLAGWGILYLALGAWWWPAAAVAVLVFVAARSKGRAAAGVLADLTETAVDLYSRDLARQLGIRCEGPFTYEIGQEVTERLRKDRPYLPIIARMSTDKGVGDELESPSA